MCVRDLASLVLAAFSFAPGVVFEDVSPLGYGKTSSVPSQDYIFSERKNSSPCREKSVSFFISMSFKEDGLFLIPRLFFFLY